MENHQRSWEPLPDSLPVVKRAWEELANSYCRTVARLTNSRRISLADDGDASILVNALQDTVKTGIQDLSLRKSSKLWDPFTGGETQKGPTGKDLKYPVKTGIRDLSSCKSSDLWNPLTCGDTQKGPTGKDLKYRDALCSSLCKNYPGLATAFSFGKDPELQGRQLVKKLCGTGELITRAGLEY